MDQILLFQKSFYVGTNVFVPPHLSSFTYQDQIGSDFFDFPLMFTKGKIFASLWVLPNCVGSPGTAGMGVSYFQLQSYCQPGHDMPRLLEMCLIHYLHDLPLKEAVLFSGCSWISGVRTRVRAHHYHPSPLLSKAGTFFTFCHYLFFLCL